MVKMSKARIPNKDVTVRDEREGLVVELDLGLRHVLVLHLFTLRRNSTKSKSHVFTFLRLFCATPAPYIIGD